MKTLKEIRSHTYRAALNSRNLNRYVLGAEFEVAFTQAPEKLKEEFVILIEKGELYLLSKLIRSETEATLGDFNIRQLRSVASQMGIVRYSFLTKAELLIEISKRSSNDKAAV